MRLSRADFSSSCKSFLNIEFASQDITAFGGLELVRRYLALIELGRRVRSVFARYEVGGDYRAIDMILVIVVLILVGGRRLEHLNYICDDPLVKRFCGLLRLPRERSVARWLKRFTHKSVMALVEINSQIVGEAIEKQSLARLTFDIDGSVITTGATVAWAYRGFNPHHRKDPSYYPILAHVAQTGHILRVKNRPGNVHDSKGALAFIRELIDDVRVRLGKSLPLEFRMDGAFFQREIIALLERTKSRYAIKVPFVKWLGLVPIIRERQRWHQLVGSTFISGGITKKIAAKAAIPPAVLRTIAPSAEREDADAASGRARRRPPSARRRVPRTRSAGCRAARGSPGSRRTRSAPTGSISTNVTTA